MTAEERGIGVGDVISAIVETRLANVPRPDNEIAFRLILVGEHQGQVIGPTGGFPLDWMNVGRLTPDECRDLATAYNTWKKKHNGSLE